MEAIAGAFALLHGLYDWTVAWAGSPYAVWALVAIAFAESSVFPVPPDVLLIVLCLGDPGGAFGYAAAATAGSVLGGMAGYGIGYGGGRPLMERVFSRTTIQRVHDAFQRYEAWAVAIAGFTPIPYKVFTIGAGVFYVDFKVFVLASVLSRGARFFLVAGLLYVYGAPIKAFIERYFELLTVVFVVLLIAGFLVLRRLAPRVVRGAAPTR